MGTTTGPILTAGGITAFNVVVLQGELTNNSGVAVVDHRLLRIGIATAIGAAGMALWEAATPRTATAVSWLVLMTVLLVRVDPSTPSPLETLSKWYATGV
jgi:hypothetical protein